MIPDAFSEPSKIPRIHSAPSASSPAHNQSCKIPFGTRDRATRNTVQAHGIGAENGTANENVAAKALSDHIIDLQPPNLGCDGTLLARMEERKEKRTAPN